MPDNNSLLSKSDAMNWLKSPYILCALVGIVAIYVFLTNADTHFIDADKEPCYLTVSHPLEADLKGIENKKIEIPANTKLRLYGKWGYGYLVEDTSTGLRCVVNLGKDSLAKEGSADALNRRFDPEFKSYVKADNTKDIFVGRKINEIIKKYGDYTMAVPEEGIYFFRYLTPLVDGTRYESGLTLHTDSTGTILSSSVPQKSHTSSNFFKILPFYSTICSWNLATHSTNKLYSSDNDSEEESSGFFGTIFGWIISLIVGILKFGLLLVILALMFILPGMIIASITGPMIYMKHISSTTIDIINYCFTIPLEYIILVSLLDVTHGVWLVTLPLFVMLAFIATMMPSNMTSSRRCPKCRSVDSIKHKYTVIDTRERTEIENVDIESDKAKYKGYNLAKLRHEWGQDIEHLKFLVTITETDTQDDWHCTICGDSGSKVTTTVKRKRELIDTRKETQIWVEKDSLDFL